MKGYTMRDFRWFTDFFNTGLGTAIKAVLLLVLAFIVAAIAKSLIIKLLSKNEAFHHERNR